MSPTIAPSSPACCPNWRREASFERPRKKGGTGRRRPSADGDADASVRGVSIRFVELIDHMFVHLDHGKGLRRPALEACVCTDAAVVGEQHRRLVMSGLLLLEID